MTFSPAATDNAPGAVSLDSTHASGSTFPIGTTTVAVNAVDANGNTSACSFTITVLGARGVMQNVLAEVDALRGSIPDRRDGRRLDQVIADLTAALDAELWLDQTHVRPVGGKRVFNQTRAAIHKLCRLIEQWGDSIPDDALQGFIDRLARAMRLLATTAISDAAGASVTYQFVVRPTTPYPGNL